MSTWAGWLPMGAVAVAVVLLLIAGVLGWLDARCEAAGHAMDADGRCHWCRRLWPPGRCPANPTDPTHRRTRASQRPGGDPSP